MVKLRKEMLMKSIIKFVVLLSIEGYFFQKVYQSRFDSSAFDLESFFFGWGFLFLALFLFNAFNVSTDGNMTGVIGSLDKNNSVANSRLTGIHSERTLAGENRNTRFIGGLKDRISLVYLLLFIVNVLGYIKFMPRY